MPKLPKKPDGTDGSTLKFKKLLPLLTRVIKFVIKQLVTGKVKGLSVLKSESNADKVAESDLFSVNDQFGNPRKDKNRKFEIDVAVVRTMKGKKKVEHTILVSEILEQLCHIFKPEVKIINERVECPIDQKYMKRDDKKEEPLYLLGVNFV